MKNVYQMKVSNGDDTLILHFDHDGVMNEVERLCNKIGLDTDKHPGALVINKSVSSAMSTISFWFSKDTHS